MSAPAIRCSQLCKHFGDVRALCGVDLEVKSGRFAALLGPSGCGKTTVLRSMAGLETPDRGEIEIGGVKVFGPDTFVPPEKRRVGMVFQEYALFPHLSVAQNVGFGLSRNGNSADRVKEMLTLVGLADARGRMPGELSGGEQQRIALARALAPRPDVILLDEPFSNLDAALRVRVRAEVRQILRQAGVTAVFVTHDQEEALSMADEIAVMMNGKILQTGAPQAVYRRPVSREVATFLGEANFLRGRADGSQAVCEIGRLPMNEDVAGEIDILIRPEDLAITTGPGGTAEIVDVEFFGHDELVELRLESGRKLLSRQWGACGSLEVGRRVNLHVTKPVMAYPV